MPFIELEDGSEILLDVSDIPEPPASTFTDNPHEANTTRFKRWRALAKARYAKACYKATVDAKNEKHFLSIVGDAKAVLQDSSSWDNYKSCRGLEEYKRPVGRPKLTAEEKVQRNPRVKRSDQMRVLLLEHGVVIDAVGAVSGYDNFQFLPNGKIQTDAGDRISTHQFIQDYT